MEKKPFLTESMAQDIIQDVPTPFHVYDEKGIRENARRINKAFSWNKGFKEYFAVKATPNPFIMNILRSEGCGFDCSSYTELLLSGQVGAEGHEIMFSSNATPDDDFRLAYKMGALINLDDFTHIDVLDKLTGIPEFISCRYNPGGEFKTDGSPNVMDTPKDAKYGFTHDQLIEGYRRGERLLPHGIAFTGGVLVTMGVLAGALLALRGVGMALGWGFQLQSPWVVSLLLVLFVAITINLLGVFEFTAASHLADTRVARSAPRTGAASSFFTGILAVIVASPCTAPFMGAALGYAVTQPAVEAIAVFLSLGLGMALPWLLLCIFPGWSRMLPRPGAWMDVFRKVMAIPMALAVVWLGWVLSKQVSLNGMLLMLAGCGSAAIALWLLGREQWGRGRNRVLMGVTSFLAAVIATGEFDRAATAQGRGVWQPWSEEAVRASLAEGRPVFVDFTAAWCVTCQANKVAALDRDEVQTAFRDGNVTLLMGDWTNRDPAITDILSRFGRSGVPLYLLYRPDGTVQVLPELLTPGIVLDAVKGGQQ